MVLSSLQLGVVRTEGGLVQGQNVPVGLYRTLDVFKGIPFAATPGILEKPKPHPGWDGTYVTISTIDQRERGSLANVSPQQGY